MVTHMGFEPMNVALRGLCVRPLHQWAVHIYYTLYSKKIKRIFRFIYLISIVFFDSDSAFLGIVIINVPFSNFASIFSTSASPILNVLEYSP